MWLSIGMLWGCGTSDLPPPATAPTTPVRAPRTAAAHPLKQIAVRTSGGCARGQQCTQTRLFPDGRVDVAPVGDPESRREGRIDPVIAERVFDDFAHTDIPDLIASLPPGECRGCVDGIDLSIDLTPLTGEVLSLDSQAIRIDRKTEVFANLFDALDAARANLPSASP